MKKTLLALAATCSYTAIAFAQSSVTIYGIADAGIAIENGVYAGGSKTSLISGGNAGSRLGFRGKEDLGGGLAAIFNLQSGINFDDGSLGQGGLMFGRTAFVGLEGGFGSVRLGRIDSALYASTWYYDPLGDALGGAYTRLFTLSASLRRNDNTVAYTSPTIGGFTAAANYSFGEVAGDSNRGRKYSASISYKGGPVDVSFAHQNVNSAPAAPTSVVSTKVTALGASYDFSVVKLSALYQINKDNSAASLNTRDMLIGLSLPLGAHTFATSYIRHDDKTAGSGGGANQIALGYMYSLSKRTNLYAGASRIKNESSARFGLAALASGGSVSGTSAKLYTAGIRHVF